MATSDDMMHLLVVDDDTRIRELLSSYLADHGFRITAASDANQARAKMVSLAFDLIILDIMMPGENGLEFASALRNDSNHVPVLFLSALTTPQDRINGLAVGGDDYLAKPFEPEELLLRIQSILRRQEPKQETPNEIKFGEFSFNLSRGQLRKTGVIVHLTTRETEMLRVLANNAGEAVSRQELAQKNETSENTRGVDVQINRLRAKIETTPTRPIYLQTVRARGYVLHAG